MTADHERIAVLGLGPMGQAMVHALLAAGHPVTVWNRTASRADGVVASGARRAADAAAAIRDVELVVLSLTDYQAMYDILEPALAGDADVLRGRVLVNLSSDTPDRTREAAEWATAHGAEFVTGGVMVPAPVIGTDDAYVYYSGPAGPVERHRRTLQRIGAVRYLGADPRAAQLLYQAQLDVFLTALSGVLHGAALAVSGGLDPEEFLTDALQTLIDTPAMVGGAHELGERLRTGKHPGELSTATMMGATAEHILATSASIEVDVELPRAVASQYRRAIAAGHGRDDWSSLFEVISPSPR